MQQACFTTPSSLSRGRVHITTAGTLALLALAVGACGDGQRGDVANRGDFKVNLVSTGSGQIHPLRIRRTDELGNPTDTVLNIEDAATLRAHLNSGNAVLPLAAFGTTATLPNGAPGNHFFFMRFSHELDVESILSSDVGSSTNSGLTTAITLLAYDPRTERTGVLVGRGFVGGHTYVNRGGQLTKVRAVEVRGGAVQMLEPEAQGFPLGFTGAVDLVARNAFVFVADTDQNLQSFETFPHDQLLRVEVGLAVRDSAGHPLEQELVTATTVGADPSPPDVLGFGGQRQLGITPGDGERNVEPDTLIVIRFNKPVQPADVGTLFDAANLTPQARGVSISVTHGPDTVPIPYHADPFSIADFCNYRVRPAWPLPAGGEFSIQVSVTREHVHGIADVTQTLGNDASVRFVTGEGPGMVNAPVAPEAIYVGMGGAEPGVSVIDLNGLGQSTGDPQISRSGLNPNIGQQEVDPPLTASPDRSSIVGGSAGVFTLTQDSRGRTRLLDRSAIGSVGDIQIGCPLDLVYNDEAHNRMASRTNQVNPLTHAVQVGNNITTPPHPNPPRLDLARPPAPERGVFGQRPTRTSSSGAAGTVLVTTPLCAVSPRNLLVAGNPFANDRTQVGIFGGTVQGVFNGPQPPPPSPPPTLNFCPFTSRQQIGHFLYVLDRDNRQVLVVNSNRFTVLDRIRLSDPVDMAISPNLRRLAVTNFSSSTVSIIDIDPLSSQFHRVIAETRVPRGPGSVAWQPDGEDLFVVCTPSSAVVILGGRDYQNRREIGGFLHDPVDVSVTERFANTGNLSGVYYAYILNGNGTIAVYESGPDGVNGIGFNDVVGLVQGNSFRRATRLLHDYTVPMSAVMVAHVDTTGVGQVSRLELTSSPTLPQPTQQGGGGQILPPTFRQKQWTVTQRFGGIDVSTPVRDQLSGNAPVDLAMDEITNVGAFADWTTPFNQALQATPMGHSGKAVVKVGAGGGPVRGATPRFLFVAVADSGRVDVFGIDSGQRLASIAAPGVRVVASYWRQ